MPETPTHKRPRMPKGLVDEGRRVWLDVTKVYSLRPDELRTLEDACREYVLIDRLEAELAGAAMIVEGSMGQPVANPLASEIRQHRATAARLIAMLKLPDDPGAGKQSNTGQQRAAGHARWSSSHGATG